MENKRTLRESIQLYRGAIIDIIRYQFIIALLMAIISVFLSSIAAQLIRSTGRPAITTGDFSFLFKTWQGPLLIIIALAVLFIYVAFDLNTQIIYSAKYLNGGAELLPSIKEGFYSIKKFLNINGLGVVIYITLIAPIVGVGFAVSQTRNLYIPKFISSVIFETPLFLTIYIIAVIIFVFLGIINIFIIHGVVLSNLDIKYADDCSRKLLKENLKHFLLSQLKFGLAYIIVLIILIIIIAFIPIAIIAAIIRYAASMRAANIFMALVSTIIFALFAGCFKFFYLMRITELYYQYRNEPISVGNKRNYKKTFAAVCGCVFLTMLTVSLSIGLDHHFEEVFRPLPTTEIIAHRAGGVEGPENTVVGINKAVEAGIEAAEIDIQRTKDGHYIVNHDDNFSRLCGNSAKPSDLTLEEIEKLIIVDSRFPNDPQSVSTFEDMLEATKDRITLFVELKGATADEQMCDDAVRMIKERGMEEECVLISLKYSLIDYIETKYPEMQTGYLLFAGFGNLTELNCDYVGLEEESATTSNITNLQKAGKKVMVWTLNDEDDQRKYLLSQADYIITDQIVQAKELKEKLSHREDVEVIMDYFGVN